MNIPSFKFLQPPAKEDDLKKLFAEVGLLPSAYVDFLRASNGAECGPNDEQGDSLHILAAGEVSAFGLAYSVPKYLPDLMCFASDGGDYAFAFQRDGDPDD